MKIPESLLYSPQHLWTRAADNGHWEAGITDYAQDLLGDIVFAEAPAPGTQLRGGQPCGLVESVKTGSDLHALVDGTVTEINQDVIHSPEQINENPYKAWIFKYKPADAAVEKQLLRADSYKALIDND